MIQPILHRVTFPMKTLVYIVLMASSLNLDTHISLMARSTSTQLKLVHELHPFLEMLDLAYCDTRVGFTHPTWITMMCSMWGASEDGLEIPKCFSWSTY